MDRQSLLRRHDQEVVRPISNKGSPEAHEEEMIRAAVINRSAIATLQPRSASTFDVTLPEYPDKKFVPNFPLVMRDELTEDNDMTLNPGGVREKAWRDSYLTDLLSIHLRRLNGCNLLELCKDVLTGLTHKMTERRAANIMLLAWNMRQFDMVSHVFPVKNPCAAAADIDMNTLTTRPFGRSRTHTDPYVRPEGIEDDQYVAACAYISASTLRLFSKSPENYMTAVAKHIPHMFYRFYNIDFPLTGFKPDKKCIEALKLIYETKSAYRNTLAPFLYEFKGLGDAKRMCQMLYEQDLAFTGLHVVNLYLRACFGLHASLIQLGACLWHQMTKNTLISLCRVCRTYVVNPSVENSRETWKYARLYGTEYFPLLKSDKCNLLLCCLAIICKKLGISKNQDMMVIARTRKAEFIWKNSNVWANRAVLWFRANASPHHGRSQEVSSRIWDDAPSKKRTRADGTQDTRVAKSRNRNLQ
ncbi:uncharacterized protein [Triticum aestivum]|uniref:uncharacterized protein n=1 Tax=Triticum aestivum TaxID=4565 RepID=UPI001D01B572|nr:uncharacterized protein LOC123150699 [Triticum aestivum]